LQKEPWCGVRSTGQDVGHHWGFRATAAPVCAAIGNSIVSGRNGGNGVDVEVRETFQSLELGVGDVPGAAAFAAVVDLCG